LQTLESAKDDGTSLQEPLCAVGKAGGFTGAELASRSGRYALVPTGISQLAYQLIQHRFLLLLLKKLLHQCRVDVGGIHVCFSTWNTQFEDTLGCPEAYNAVIHYRYHNRIQFRKMKVFYSLHLPTLTEEKRSLKSRGKQKTLKP
jgi:hypothetical protein